MYQSVYSDGQASARLLPWASLALQCTDTHHVQQLQVCTALALPASSPHAVFWMTYGGACWSMVGGDRSSAA